MKELKYRRDGTKTSSFGTPGRINHDSSEFYDSKLYADKKPPEKIKFIENHIPSENIDKIYCKSSEIMDDIPDYSVHLMVTSLSYNIKKEYDKALSLDEYRSLLKTVFKETYKKLVTGGRVCIIVANLGRKPYIPLHSYIIEDMQEIGYFMRGEIIWNKASSASPSTAWGSWQSAANPVLRDIHEYILVFSKESFSRKRGHRKDTISKEEFLEWTKSVWTFPAVSARSIGHPAPFPEELPHRLIQLYTFKEDIVLDPFCGSGTACLAALKDGRHYIGYGIGTPRRINHDSSEFYDSKLYANKKPPEKIKFIENHIPSENIDKIYCKSSEIMDDIPDYSVHLMVTSPPYNVKKEYDKDLSLDEYRSLLKTVFKETYKKLVTGGMACINVANLGRKPYIPLHSYIIEDMQEIGYFMRGEIIWNKASSASPSTAWGSWQSAANPVLRDIHEYILVFSKESFSRKRGHRKDTISKEEFLEWTKNVWTFPAVSARSIGHPAPFPEELPHRLIQLYTFKEEVVLDPFCGSGTACLAALKDGRHYIGYDIESEYVKLANQRIKAHSSQKTLFEYERPSRTMNPNEKWARQSV